MLRIEPLDGKRHERKAFCCGEATLDDYLQRLAGQHQRDGIATTHVLVDSAAPATILGFYSLAAAHALLDDLAEDDRKRLPRYPVPAARLARLAVAAAHQGCGLGEALLQDAVQRCLALRTELGIHVMVVDALHERAAAFYRLYGFRETAVDARTLYLPLGAAS